MSKYLCIHCHFYQPPRENPWLEEVEIQESAAPYHDWNQRITTECYAPNAAARRLDKEGRIVDIVNNYARISFNFGPTLLSWMEHNESRTYRSILMADAYSKQHFSGHGSALAQCYNHIIMPLASSRDKEAQIIWGIKDFEHRFKRVPEGMWLPETAVDYESLDLMAKHGILFTILAPHQAAHIRKIGSENWEDVSGGRIYIKRPYSVRLPSGRSIVIFFYDGPASRDVAFGGLLRHGDNFANRLMSLYDNSQENELVHIATDGETYGHHHHMGDMGLAHCINFIQEHNHVKITNYGEYLENHPPAYEVKIFENSSWSCIHGIERWQNDCGCNSGQHPGWHQRWRSPLRNSLNWLRDTVADIYSKEAPKYFKDSTEAKNAYIDVILDRSVDNANKYLSKHCVQSFSKIEKTTIFKLLEMQRYAMLMFTSCGWFFDEISGIETKQILSYSARVMQLAHDICSIPLESAFINMLALAPSNIKKYENGASIFRQEIQPSVLDLVRVGAHYAVSSVFEQYSDTTPIYSYQADSQFNEKIKNDEHTLSIGKARIFSTITWEEIIISYAVLHLGSHNLTGGVREYLDDKKFNKMQQEMKDIFNKNDVLGAIRTIEKHFDTGHYNLWHLFRDEQVKVLYQILDTNLIEVERSIRQINECHYPIIQVIKQLNVHLPKMLQNTVLVMLNADMLHVLSQEPIDFYRLDKLIEEVKEWNLEIDKKAVSYILKRRINELMERFIKHPRKIMFLETMERLIVSLVPLNLTVDLWQAQNMYFYIGKRIYPKMKARASLGHEKSQRWIHLFRNIGEQLKVKLT